MRAAATPHRRAQEDHDAERRTRAWESYQASHRRSHPHAALLAEKIADCFRQSVEAPNRDVRQRMRAQGFALEAQALQRFGLRIRQV